MLIFEVVLVLLLVGVVLSALADRFEVPYPALLALAGAALSLLPGLPQVTLDPELALALFVAPVLLDAAFDASPRDLRDNLIPVSSLALVAVALTIAGVACVARLCVPGMAWAAAITLGAIVAPPDASAATAVLRRLRPPHRLVVILEGESLFNDASALLVYRIAVGCALTGTFSGWSIVPTLLVTCGGGVILGVLLGRFFVWLGQKVVDLPSAVLTQFLSTFAVWILADRLGLSAIITLVAYAMTLARYTPGITNARRRIASYAVWDLAVFVLNVLAFVLIGLQLRAIRERLSGSDQLEYTIAAAAVCVTVILVRVVWWMTFNTAVRLKLRRWPRKSPRPLSPPTIGTGLLISWCGMRGIVTLAAALALPDGSDGPMFPQRDLILVCAFWVVLSTLVVQGLTLRPLLKRLGLRDDDTVGREIQLARAETARAVLNEIEGGPSKPAAELLRREYAARLRSSEQLAGNDDDNRNIAALQREAVSVQRRALIDLRARSLIGDDAFHVAEEELDLLELSSDGRIHPDG